MCQALRVVVWKTFTGEFLIRDHGPDARFGFRCSLNLAEQALKYELPGLTWLLSAAQFAGSGLIW